jgi:hypothetical protein
MDDTEKIAEELLILRLLTGHTANKQGHEVTIYLKHNSLEERKARAALAQQLRDGTLGYIAR